MSRTDVLSKIKEAESKADAIIAQAEADEKSTVAQTRSDSVKRIQKAETDCRTAYESALAAEQKILDEEKANQLVIGKKNADIIGIEAKKKNEDVNSFLMDEFKRAIDASS